MLAYLVIYDLFDHCREGFCCSSTYPIPSSIPKKQATQVLYAFKPARVKVRQGTMKCGSFGMSTCDAFSEEYV